MNAGWPLFTGGEMIQSTITSTFQTTVPAEVRAKLGLEPNDILRWELVGSDVRIVPLRLGFLSRRGSLRVGPGSVVDDIRRARLLRGAEPP